MAQYRRLIVPSFVLLGLLAAAGCQSFEGAAAAPAGPPPSAAASTGAAAAPLAAAVDEAVAAPAGEAEATPAAQRRPVTTENPFAEARRRIEEARSLPVADGNYRIQVERIWFAESESQAIGALLGYAGGNFGAVAGGLSPDAGFTVGMVSGSFFAALDGHVRSHRGTSREQIMLVTMPGFPASLAIGETRYVIPFTVGGMQFGMLVPQGQLIGTSLEAICQPMGEGRVQVQLTPVFTDLGRGGETVRVTQATTAVVVPLGQPLLIASQDRSAHSVANALLSRRTERGMEQAVLLLTVN